MKFINDETLNDKINMFVKDMNNLFKDADTEIKDILIKQNKNTRQRILTFRDVLCYKFNYSFKYEKQLNVINEYKINNNVDCHKSAFYRKESKIPLEYYKNIHERILNIHNKYTGNYEYNIIAVDGTYNNTNINNNKNLETSLNMGYYDVNNNIPIELKFKGEHYKNREIDSLIEQLEENKIQLSNIILVLDRGYCSYDLFDYLHQKNIKFVIRIRNNCKCIKNNNISNYNSNYRIVNYNYNTSSIKELKNKKKNITENYNVIINVNCNMITNLNGDIFNNEYIREIYNSRWKVEEFFKLIKSNFNFSNMKEHNTNTEITYMKSYYVIQIICILEGILEKIFIDHIDKSKQNYEDYNIKINKSSLIKGIEEIINDVIFSRLNKCKVSLLGKIYINFSYCKKNTNNPRISKTPFTKWYVKDYHSKYDTQKIFDAYITDDETSINKNLKMKLKNFTFIKIE
jgi:hypothetical protein